MTHLEMLRKAGWTVAIHNDYKVGGASMTFWLFTHPSGIWAKGEGADDREALREALWDAAAQAEKFDLAEARIT